MSETNELEERRQVSCDELRNLSLKAVGAYFKHKIRNTTKTDVARIAGVTGPAIHRYMKTMTWARCNEILGLLDIHCDPIDQVLGFVRLQPVVYRGEMQVAVSSKHNEHVVLVERENTIVKMHAQTHMVLSTYRKERP